MDDVLSIIKKKKKVYRIILMIISLIISSLVYNIFLLPLNLVTGGAPGVATITHHIYDIDPATMILFISIAIGIISFMYLGIERTSGTIMSIILYPLLVKLTSPLVGILTVSPEDMIITVIFAGVLNGIAYGLMYRTGYSNGGFPIISQILYEKFRLPIAKTSLVINLTIVLVGSIFFGLTNALYAIIYLYINNIVLDKVLLGISTNKSFYIITHEEEKIKDYVINVLQHNVTVFDVKGGYLDKKRKVILAIIPTKEYYRVTEGIKMLDKDAFFVVTDSYQVSGAK